MNNPLKDSLKNPIKRIYEGFWVPIFGRVLYLFSYMIEGQQPREKQTFDLREKSKQ